MRGGEAIPSHELQKYFFFLVQRRERAVAGASPRNATPLGPSAPNAQAARVGRGAGRTRPPRSPTGNLEAVGPRRLQLGVAPPFSAASVLQGNAVPDSSPRYRCSIRPQGGHQSGVAAKCLAARRGPIHDEVQAFPVTIRDSRGSRVSLLRHDMALRADRLAGIVHPRLLQHNCPPCKKTCARARCIVVPKGHPCPAAGAATAAVAEGQAAWPPESGPRPGRRAWRRARRPPAGRTVSAAEQSLGCGGVAKRRAAPFPWLLKKPGRLAAREQVRPPSNRAIQRPARSHQALPDTTRVLGEPGQHRPPARIRQAGADATQRPTKLKARSDVTCSRNESQIAWWLVRPVLQGRVRAKVLWGRVRAEVGCMGSTVC